MESVRKFHPGSIVLIVVVLVGIMSQDLADIKWI
jgi:hypothetical protein